MRPFDLQGLVGVVFGGTSGIGRSIALGLREAGAHVVVSSRDPGKLAAMGEELSGEGSRGLVVAGDVTQRHSLELVRDAVLREFARIDVLVNSAGAYLRKPTADIVEHEWGRVLECNLTGTFLACQVFGREMIRQGKGSIINIASLGAHVALSEAAPYCASKAGVLLLTKCLAIEWARHNVRVNTITPGVFRTSLNEQALAVPARLERIINRTALSRLGETAELAGAAVFLASDASRFVTGSDIVVDGGFLAGGI